MEKINWCFKQKNGIELVKPNLEISSSYIKRAQKDFENIKKQDENWKVIISYYACYNSLYSVFIRYGVKCEIHSCSIELLRYFSYLKEYIDFLEELKQNRVNVQYYLKNAPEINLKKIEEFILDCKLELDEVNQDKISKLKKILEEVQK